MVVLEDLADGREEVLAMRFWAVEKEVLDWARAVVEGRSAVRARVLVQFGPESRVSAAKAQDRRRQASA